MKDTKNDYSVGLLRKIQRTIILWAFYSYESKRFNLSGACFIFREVSRRVNLSRLLLINNYLSSRDHCWWSMNSQVGS